MCKLVTIENSNGAKIEVADIKAEIIKKIITLAHACDTIDYIYVFGSTVEESCTDKSDIDIAIISNVTRSKLFQSKSYNEFTNKLYGIDIEQDYDILQFNSLDAIKNSDDYVCKDIIDKGKLLYERKGASYHAQQAIELIIKYEIYNNINYNKGSSNFPQIITHDLDRLIRMYCIPYGIVVPKKIVKNAKMYTT